MRRRSQASADAAAVDRLRLSPLDLLLPYQLRWVHDSARFKIWLKSRQIGGSLAAAFEVVADAIESGSDWVILSAGERQALEFMEKVNRAASIFCDAVTSERKRELFERLKKVLQARTVQLPPAAVIRDDLGSVQRLVSPAGVVRYAAARTVDGHADRSTALALAVHAAQRNPSLGSRRPRPVARSTTVTRWRHPWR